ncbi:sn-glycerol-3-phosphate ABC transporter ATP-binding protein UgpC [Halorarum halophilum]|uniref:ABC-type D-xylose/L-arabinose transporter n=1 Tax=Halorarum halophilum TaxID=2743090 RepID=A0A7D5GBB6_9EURY|nr:sn-glycerol-3-phosphate ABC transporter ATP-binding protein UgpC [Halobaculum halophilum]QLG27312.1 sn-glycerol-3-phosphate ABC transporter ATP-binding protein UgpC [Halobaculum halophilum]
MARLQIDNLTKVFDADSGPIVAVEELDLDIKDGEFVVVVGPSGCGKSTTLRTVAGLETATEGEIRIGDEVINDKPPKDRDIAMVFQSYALYPHKTVRGNMAYGLRLSTDLTDEEIDKRVEEAASMMGIEDLLDKKPGSLSGGQQQRVATGRAIVREPAVFLFDEPLSNLDAKLRKHMRTELARLHTELGITTMYVTHDQEEAMTMADRIVVLNDGRLQQMATPKEVYYEPVNYFVADFIGSPSMNFFEVELETDADGGGRLGNESFTYEVSERIVNNVQDRRSDRMIMGIRPESMSPADATTPEGKTLSARVDVVEVVGSDNFIYLDMDGKECRVRTPSTIEPALDTTFEFTFDEENIHLFDIETEQALTHGTEKSTASGDQEAPIEEVGSAE